MQLALAVSDIAEMLCAKSRRDRNRTKKRHEQRERLSQRGEWAYGGIDRA